LKEKYRLWWLKWRSGTQKEDHYAEISVIVAQVNARSNLN
jgi:hypothetical protein